MSKNYDFVWDSTADRIRKGYFLPVGPKQYGSWSGTDNEADFKANLSTQPEDWFYRTHNVEYSLNKLGYRTVEFETVDWANSAVIFGCSNVFGIGIREEDTLSSQLSKLINMPVINMGIGASSMEYSLYNSVILNENYPTPKAVVQLWSSLQRTTYYNTKNVVHHGSWNMPSKGHMDLYTEDQSHPLVHGLMCQRISKMMWEKTKYYEASFFDETTLKLQLPEVHWVDQARDMSHPGRLTLGKLAEQIAENIK